MITVIICNDDEIDDVSEQVNVDVSHKGSHDPRLSDLYLNVISSRGCQYHLSQATKPIPEKFTNHRNHRSSKGGATLYYSRNEMQRFTQNFLR